MERKNTELDSKELAELAVKGMQEKKAKDIVLLDLRKTGNAVADFFVIATGNTDTQVDAIQNSVEEIIKIAKNELPHHREGYTQKQWIILDYINVVVHIFEKSRREYFGLEDLWGDAKVTRFENLD
ncbi:ribosome silencing factor [Sediminitomix flava]|uniref:Ribosomal silencing factor RsfS n=1 Tax=Sediminitomix flava TaxID=379075 RepID=A0A315ZFT7_SEDFL|nr:ribosome silencing factor [Sediminitomix flava]PWJ44445.1 ribosome-associated protein [Sediminitomix flava]